MKKVVFVCLFVLFSACFAFAQSEKTGTITATAEIGGGYTYLRDRWNIGVNGIVTYRRTAGLGASEFSMFDVFAGVSVRFF